jgi:hypothetical protein
LCLIAFGQITAQNLERSQVETIAGRVVDEYNRPVKGAKVSLTLSSQQAAAATLPSSDSDSPVFQKRKQMEHLKY